MAKYLEIINDDSGVVLDDNFQCLEVVHSVALSQCSVVDAAPSGASFHDYKYVLPFTTPSNALYGISISGIENAEYFAFTVENMRLTFWDKNSKVNGVGYYGVQRPDIAAHSTIYMFDIVDRQASEHGIGIEACNEDGKVVYSSNATYLNVLHCGSDEVKEFSASNAIVINLGYDTSTDYWIGHISGKDGAEYAKYPGYLLSGGKVKIGPVSFTMLYVSSSGTPTIDGDGNITFPSGEDKPDDWEHIFESWLAYGWLIGNIT